MAGKRDHYVPKLLQRGFLIQPGESHTYRFSKRRGIQKCGLSEVGSQYLFYGSNDETGHRTLDLKITNEENRIKDMIHQFRRVPYGSSVDPDQARALLAHYVPRTENARTLFSELGIGAIQVVNDVLGQIDAVCMALGMDYPTPTEIWWTKIDERSGLRSLIQQIPASAAAAPFFERMVYTAMRERLRLQHPAFAQEYDYLLRSLQLRISQEIEEIHNRVLDEIIGSKQAASSLNEFQWQVESPPEGVVILPDCIAISMDMNGMKAVPFMLRGSSCGDIIAFPISNDRIIVGRRQGVSSILPGRLNHILAACSYDFFVCGIRDVDLEALVGQISIGWREGIDDLMSSLLCEYSSVKKNKELRYFDGSTIMIKAESFCRTHNEFEFSKFFLSLCHLELTGNRITCVPRLVAADSVNEAIQGIIFDARNSLDYHVYFEEIDVGVWCILQHSSGKVLAVDIVILRAGLPAGKSIGLVLQSEGQRIAVAIYAFFDAVVRRASVIPGQVDIPIQQSRLGRLLASPIRSAIFCYVIGQSLGKLPENDLERQFFETDSTSILESTRPKILQVLQSLDSSENLEDSFAKIIEQAVLIGRSLGRLLGFYDAIDASISDMPDDLKDILTFWGLENWIEYFSADLRRFWTIEEVGLDDFFAMQVHSERLLIAFGLAVFPSEDGDGFIIQPLYS